MEDKTSTTRVEECHATLVSLDKKNDQKEYKNYRGVSLLI